MNDWDIVTYSATLAIKLRAISSRSAFHTTAGIPIRLVVTIFVIHCAAFFPFNAHRAAFRCVKRRLASKGSSIGGFHHIDLSVLRPVVRVCQPQSRPRTTPVRGMDNVEDEKSICIGIVGCDSYRLAPISSLRSTVCRVHLEHR
jgi:hypothetical protein